MINLDRTIQEINQKAEQCGCGHPHRPIRLHGAITGGALMRVPEYVLERQFRRVLLVVDDNTWSAAGQTLSAALTKASIEHTVCTLEANAQGDVLADELSIVQIVLHTTSETDAIVAVGAGTIHDAVRFVCAKLGKAFLSVPTAASVDGFASTGAPIIIRGVKQTIPAISPEAMFADLDVLTRAPRALTAAGFGDMLGKYTSLADWVFSRDAGNEPFCPIAYELTEQALTSCVDAVPDIAEATERGISTLFAALTVSGLAMMITGHSRSASGAEHHLSHYWEMECIRHDRRQLLHGAKVGVAATWIAALYRKLRTLSAFPATKAYDRLPEPDVLRNLLEKVGGPSTLEKLGIEQPLLSASLSNAHLLRDRCTGLRWLHESGVLAQDDAPLQDFPILFSSS